MLQKVTITLTPSERLALERLARGELREPKDFVRWLIRDAAISRGFIQPEPTQGQRQEDRHASAN
jgi:hypothetical protein